MIRLITITNLYSYITEPAYRTAIHHILKEQFCILKLQLKLLWIKL